MIFLLSCFSSSDSIDHTDTSSEPSDVHITDTYTEPSAEPDNNIEEDSASPPVDFSLSLLVDESIYGGLSFHTNLPMQYTDCIQLPMRNVPCTDRDEDGLTDEWEEGILTHVRPVLRLDEDEGFLSDPTAVLAYIGRVTPTPSGVDVFIVLAWSEDYGRCGVSAHHGDSERVVIRMIVDEENIRFHKVYTAAHEGEITDAGEIWEQERLLELTVEVDEQSGFAQWVAFPSEDKHATYGSIEACEQASLIPCIEEDCAPDNVSDPTSFDVIGEILNVGEEDFPLATELDGIGFPGDHAWNEQDFCGGLGGTACSSPIREKLLMNPFE